MSILAIQEQMNQSKIQHPQPPMASLAVVVVCQFANRDGDSEPSLA